MIAITPAEAKVISVALRYQAQDIRYNMLELHDLVNVDDLLALANQIDERLWPAQPPPGDPAE